MKEFIDLISLAYVVNEFINHGTISDDMMDYVREDCGYDHHSNYSSNAQVMMNVVDGKINNDDFDFIHAVQKHKDHAAKILEEIRSNVFFKKLQNSNFNNVGYFQFLGHVSSDEYWEEVKDVVLDKNSSKPDRRKIFDNFTFLIDHYNHLQVKKKIGELVSKYQAIANQDHEPVGKEIKNRKVIKIIDKYLNVDATHITTSNTIYDTVHVYSLFSVYFDGMNFFVVSEDITYNEPLLLSKHPMTFVVDDLVFDTISGEVETVDNGYHIVMSLQLDDLIDIDRIFFLNT